MVDRGETVRVCVASRARWHLEGPLVFTNRPVIIRAGSSGYGQSVRDSRLTVLSAGVSYVDPDIRIVLSGAKISWKIPLHRNGTAVCAVLTPIAST